VFINTVDASTGYTADVAMDSFICQGANAGYTADAAMHSYICQTQDCSYSSTHFYQHHHLFTYGDGFTLNVRSSMAPSTAPVVK
jgi:hypothetical protein